MKLTGEPPGRPQGWPDCDSDIAAFVEGMVELLQVELRRTLLGVYLHGSLAMGS